MQKIIAFLGRLSVGLVLSTSMAMAGSSSSFSLSGTNNTTAETLTSSSGTGTFSLAALGTLTVSGSSAALTLNGSNPSTMSVTNLGTMDQTGSAQAVVDAGGHMTIIINNGSSSNSAAEMETANGDVIHLDHATNNVTLNNYGSIISTNTSAGGNQAVDWNGLTDGGVASQGSNTLNNYSTGLIQATESDAVRPGVNGFVYNSGKIYSTTTTGSSSDGIDLQTNTGVTVTNAAGLGTGGLNLIEGARHGITGGDTGTLNGVVQTGTQPGGYTGTGAYALTVVNNAGGTIQGDNGSGINIDGFGIQGTGSTLVTNESVSVTNHGTISGNGVTGDGDGIDVDGDVTVDNFGSIISKNAVPDAGGSGPEFSEGITVGGAAITNETGATIEGEVAVGNTQAVGRGITLAGIDHDVNDSDFPIQSIYENSTITNSGLIKGDSESGIAVLGTTGGGYTVTITNNATGKIEGNNSGVNEGATFTSGTYINQFNGQSQNQAAIELDDAGNNYVITNYGTIQQDNTSNGTAVAMHGASNTLNIYGGAASVIGNISGNTAANSTLTINPGAGGSFSYGYQISNFTVKINSDGTNGTVTLSGANTYSGGTTISGGKLYVNNDPSLGSGTGSGNVTVQSGGTLAGSGKISGAVTVQSGGTLASGAAQTTAQTHVGGSGVDTVTGAGLTVDLAVNGGATLQFDLGAGASTGAFNFASPNLNSTYLTSTGPVTFGTTGGAVNITLVDLTAFSTDATLQLRQQNPYLLIAGGLDSSYDLVTTGGYDQNGYVLGIGSSDTGTTILNTFSLSATDINGGALNAPYNGMQLYLYNGDLEVVPEPGTWAMMLGGVAVLIFVQMRRRSA